jgi:hypothetical protein
MNYRQAKVAQGIAKLNALFTANEDYFLQRYVNLGDGIGVKSGLYNLAEYQHYTYHEINAQIMVRNRLMEHDIYVPDVYGVAGVSLQQDGKHWTQVLFMEHIDAEEACFAFSNSANLRRVKDHVKKVMIKLGIEHQDFHDRNWLIRKDDGKIVLIDWESCKVGRFKSHDQAFATQRAVGKDRWENHEQHIEAKRAGTKERRL